MYSDELLIPWLDVLRETLPDVAIFDCHTHVGDNDPSGFSVTPDQLLDAVSVADARAAVFPLKEPEGYEQANLRAIDLADGSDGRLVAFCRIDPDESPVRLAEEALAAGARGIKLHPSSDEFEIDDDRLRGVYELADERRLPMIVHAGPELDTIGPAALELVDRYEGARLILAHGALPDLSWIYREAAGRPNLLFDTSWWGPSHTMALLTLIPPGQILSASDIPYCTPLSGALTTIRCACQAGLSTEQLRLVMGGQFERLLAGADPIDAGPPPEQAPAPVDPLLERLYGLLVSGQEPMQRGEDADQPLKLARMACRVPDDHPEADVFASVAELLDLYDAQRETLVSENPFAPGWDIVSLAAVIARTPKAPVPDLTRRPAAV
jgi:uncharacterized protein